MIYTPKTQQGIIGAGVATLFNLSVKNNCSLPTKKGKFPISVLTNKMGGKKNKTGVATPIPLCPDRLVSTFGTANLITRSLEDMKQYETPMGKRLTLVMTHQLKRPTANRRKTKPGGAPRKLFKKLF